MKDKKRKIDNSWRARMVAKGLYKDSETTSKEKQIKIEEMAREMSACGMSDCLHCNGRHKCIYYKSAEFLYIAGYRKIPKDSVVLPEGEFNYWKEFADKYIESLHKDSSLSTLNNSIVLSADKYNRLKRDRELLDTLLKEKVRLYERKLELENELTQKELTKYIGADEIAKQARKETVIGIINLIEQLRVEEDGRHEWRDRHNDTIDKVILAINHNYINGVEVD